MVAYVLGAGASYHAGYPMAGQLGDALYDWVTHNTPEHNFYRDCIELLHDTYEGLADLEQILTDIDECPATSPAAGMSPSQRGNIRQALAMLIVAFFNERRQCPSRLYDRFAEARVQQGDVIVSFNYDLACERALKKAHSWEIGNGYGFPLGVETIPSSPVTLLKLHGSTNWWGPIFGNMRGFFQDGPNALPDRPVILFPHDFEFLSYAKELADPFAPSSSNCVALPALIMLSRTKRFYVATSSGGHEWEPFWNDLWGQAGSALQSSEKIIIIGYSMPIADVAARKLLLERSNHNADVSIFCGGDSQSICREFLAAGFSRVHAYGSSRFEDFLIFPR